ncbi:MAG: Bax inhibitor-1/YccA family protein [Paracoccaceae bacterium]|nr:Bax inhibitor-1/YccA family protein [Paracoccaceae bacterium]MDE2675517.1 Bax inhibitor-1/YccA family protein [Paracoccaceae bacterium]MYG10865.1 Bax inhibitor-1/YccA family protein [Paracoccaceae bacterium]MYJ88076.1 Bax inhibitor-1/YccA family protein [Paracoccaceae bacterium]
MDRFQAVNPIGTTQAQIDEGLRAHMNRIYAYMAGAMLITGAVAYLSSTSIALMQLIYATPLQWVVMLAPLGVVFLLSARINKMSPSAAQTTFWIFSGLMGLSISYIFLVYTGYSIVHTFLVTAIAFAGLSLWGYTTKKDISGWGSFLIMGLIGIILASLVNLFFALPGLSFAISILGVLIFAGLTAYDTQRLKNEYLHFATRGDELWLQKSAILGSLSLYLNFLNLFLLLLHLFGQRE